MIMAATRIWFEVGAFDFIPLAESKRETVPFHFPARVDVAVAVSPFENFARPRDPACCELGAQQTVASRFARVETLHLGAFVEVLAYAAGKASGKSQRMSRFVGVELQQLRNGGGRAEHACDCGVVPAAPCCGGMPCGRNPAHD